MSKKRISLLGIILVVLGLCLIFLGCILTWTLPDGYQYALPAGDLSETWQEAVTAIFRLDHVVDTATISARKQDIPLQGVQGERSVTLYAVDEEYAEVYHESLCSGRFITPGDVENRRHVIVIEEDTAYALCTGGEAIGKVLNIGGTDWTIVGIIASKARFGESAVCVAYIPVTTAAEQQLSMDTLEIRMECSSGTGQDALVRTTLKQWRADGSFHNLPREKYAALIPVHWAIVVANLLFTIGLLQWLLRKIKAQYDIFQRKLQTHYVRELFLWLTGRIFLLILTGGIAAIVTAVTLNYLTAPALIFTDWIPENPVSIASYVQRFWAVHHGNTQAIQYVTREKSIVMLAAWLIRWGTLATLGGTLIQTIKWRNTK